MAKFKLPPVEDDLCDVSMSESNKLLAKSCGVVRSIAWVAKNLENKKVQMVDAPSAEAWGMLQSYRATEERKAEFWDSVFVKLIPPKAQLEEQHNDRVDGEGIIKACERLLRIRDGEPVPAVSQQPCAPPSAAIEEALS